MKRKLILMCTAGVLVLAAVIGGTLAGFNTKTEQKGSVDITTKKLSIELAGSAESEALTDLVPGGGVQDLHHSVVNDAADGYTLYTRVTIDKIWTAEDGSRLPADNIILHAGKDAVELKEGTKVNDWLVWYSDEDQVIMYYTLPVKAGEETRNFIDGFSISAKTGNAYADASADILFTVDAVQEIAAKDSIPSEWGVYPTFENGVITSIEE